MSFRSFTFATTAVALASACKSEPAPAPSTTSATATSAPATSAPPSTPHAATPAPSTAPSVASKAAATAAPNLLDIVPARVAVSSTVENPHDFPEHLFDGRMDTAWNSKTGDLHGWIAFDVPRDAHVDRVELTCGFDKISKRGEDLFTANHRITKINLLHDGKLLRTVTLDPNLRGLQPIAIDSDGGTYRLEVVETKPGTNAAWRELAVSELRVVGKPGKEKRAPNAPLQVSIRNLDGAPEVGARLDETKTEEHFADVATYCKARVATDTAAIPEAEKNIRLEGRKALPPTCVELPAPVPFAAVAPYRSLHAVRRFDGFSKWTELAVETTRGLVPIIQKEWNAESPLDPGCPSIVRPETFEEIRVDNGYLVIVYGGDRVTYVPPVDASDHGARTMLARGALFCKEAANALTCQDYTPAFNEPLGEKIQPVWDWSKRVPWSTLPWKKVVPFHIGPDGTLRKQG